MDDGRVVFMPERKHACSPGWHSKWRERDGSGLGWPSGWYSYPPSVSDYPKGTVWECANCGRTWVATGRVRYALPEFRRERERERRRRYKRAGNGPVISPGQRECCGTDPSGGHRGTCPNSFMGSGEMRP